MPNVALGAILLTLGRGTHGWFCLATLQVASGSPEVVDRLRREAPSAWQKSVQALESMQRMSVVRFDNDFGSYRSSGETKWDYRQNADCKLIAIDDMRTEKGIASESHRVLGYNKKYAFVLAKKTAQDPYAAIQVAPRKQGNLPEAVAHHLSFQAAAPAMLTSLQGLPLSEIAAGKNFRIGTAQQSFDGRVSAEFTCLTLGAHIQVGSVLFPNKVVSGHVVLDPADNWTLRSYTCVTQGQPGFHGKLNATFEVSREPADGLRIAQRLSDEFNYKDGKRRIDQSEVTVQFQDRRLPDKDFTLAAFGLTEPQWEDHRPTPWWLWAVGGLFLCLSVFLAFKRLAARSA